MDLDQTIWRLIPELEFNQRWLPFDSIANTGTEDGAQSLTEFEPFRNVADLKKTKFVSNWTVGEPPLDLASNPFLVQTSTSLLVASVKLRPTQTGSPTFSPDGKKFWYMIEVSGHKNIRPIVRSVSVILAGNLCHLLVSMWESVPSPIRWRSVAGRMMDH